MSKRGRIVERAPFWFQGRNLSNNRLICTLKRSIRAVDGELDNNKNPYELLNHYENVFNRRLCEHGAAGDEARMMMERDYMLQM